MKWVDLHRISLETSLGLVELVEFEVFHDWIRLILISGEEIHHSTHRCRFFKVEICRQPLKITLACTIGEK